MKNFGIAVILIFCCLLNVSCEKNKIKPVSIDEEIERIVMPYIISGERVGVAVGTFDNGSTEFYSYGVRSLKSGDLIDEQTMFDIGSITKTFTTTVLAKKHLEGVLDLNDDLQDYFKGYATIPRYANQSIKLVHLANHTSSLPREAENLETSNVERIYLDYTVEQFYSFINSYSLPRAIGSEIEYSNIGMGILGYTLKEQQGKSYYQMLRDEILIPLGMNSTVVDFSQVAGTNIAQGYEGNKEKPQMLFSEVYEGAGILKSNMDDMWKYLKAQFNQSNDTLYQAIQMTHTKTAGVSDDKIELGLGWHILDLDDGQRVIWHNGGTFGYNSFIGFNKELGTGVIVLMNTANEYSGGETRCGIEIMKAFKKF